MAGLYSAGGLGPNVGAGVNMGYPADANVNAAAVLGAPNPAFTAPMAKAPVATAAAPIAYGAGAITSTGIILVLFILLVIISRYKV